MKITAIKTEKIVPDKKNLFSILDQYIEGFREKSILAVTSKIVSICEGRAVPIAIADKQKLIEEEADLFLPPEENKYNITLAVKNNILAPSAGIDESNANGHLVLWPADPQKSANEIRKYLMRRFNVKRAGVIITDSKTTPLRWGTTGVAIAHSGFSALKNYIGRQDLFGRKLIVTKANMMDALAVAAVLVMGEGNEQTPIAVIEDIPFIKFQSRNPTKKELLDLQINIEEDLYAPILKSAKWRKGGKT